MEVATNYYPKLKTVVNEPKSFSKQLSALEAVYNSMEIGAYNDEILSRISKDGLVGILTEYKKKVTEEIENSGIKSKRLAAILLQSYDEAADDLQNAVNKLIEEVARLDKKKASERITARQMKVSFMGLNSSYIGFTNQNAKRLQIGIGAGFITECNKSFEFSHCKIDIYPADATYYIYAKVNRASNKATLVALTEPQDNTDNDFFILWQSGSFQEIKIPA